MKIRGVVNITVILMYFAYSTPAVLMLAVFPWRFRKAFLFLFYLRLFWCYPTVGASDWGNNWSSGGDNSCLLGATKSSWNPPNQVIAWSARQLGGESSHYFAISRGWNSWFSCIINHNQAETLAKLNLVSWVVIVPIYVTNSMISMCF